MKYFIGIIVLAAIVLGGWYYSTSQSALVPAPQDQQAVDTGVSSAMPAPGAPAGTVEMEVKKGATVTYSSSGFSPASVTIKKGETVTFVDEGTGPMWVASAVHPDHTAYSGTTRSAHCPDTTGTAFDQCATGNSYSFTFDKVGTWHYHNHVAASDTGTIVVVE
ncbi:hypothetical protein HZC00_02425 [Candidatus Kaiserbacteria bacterium]|nr:hypothetical protein [Candidatus Kaiserbacteria bacterium]